MEKRLTFCGVRFELGLRAGFVIRAKADLETAMSAWKREAVQARRAGNVGREIVLSQCKELIKVAWRKRCVKCGGPKSRNGSYPHCNMCRPDRLHNKLRNTLTA